MKYSFSVQIQASPTVAINSLALEKIRRGEKLFRLNVGEPKVETSQLVKKAVIKAVSEGKTHYPPVAGLPELRKEASKWMNKNYFSSYKPENCLVVNGGKLGIFLTLQAMLKAGDEVLLPSPYWVSYPAHAKLFKGKLKLIQTNESNGWKISAKDIQKAASRKAKFLVINSANNPTGAVYSKKEFAEILSIAKKLNLLVISDEVYSSLVYGNKKFVSAASFKKYKDRVIVIQSCSKNFAMTGFRVGFVFAPKEIVSVLTNLLSQSTSGADTLAQWAALAALKNHLQITFKIKLEMQKRREVFFREFERNFKVKLKWPDSSIYAFLPISAFGSKEKSSIKFCKTILEKTNVVLVPGIAFGREGYVRCSFGEKERIIRQAIKRIAKFLNK